MKKVKIIFPDGSVGEIDEADVESAISSGATLYSDEKKKSKTLAVTFADGSSGSIDEGDYESALSAGAIKKKDGSEIGGIALKTSPNGTPPLLQSQNSLRAQQPVPEVSTIDPKYKPVYDAVTKARPDDPQQRRELYDQIISDYESGDEARMGKAKDELSALDQESNPKVLTPKDRAELITLTGTEDPVQQLEVLNARLGGSALNPLTNIDLTTLPAADSEKLGKYRDKLAYLSNKKNTEWSQNVITKGGEQTTELENVLNMTTGLPGLMNASVEEAKRYNAEKLTDSYSTGLESIKYTDPARYQRNVDAIKNGKILPTTDVVDLTAIGAKILETQNAQELVDRKISYDDFSANQQKYIKDQQDNVYQHSDFLRSVISGVIAKHYDKSGTIVAGPWMITDKQIDAVPESEFAAQGLDINHPEFKKQIEFLKQKEGWFPFQNAIAKDDLLREFRKGFSSTLEGIVSTADAIAADVVDAEDDLLLDRRTQGFNVSDIANKRGEYFNDHYGKYADAFSGLGQFVSQLALMATGEGAIAAGGEAIGGGSVAARLMGATRLEKFGNLLVDNAGLYSTYGTSFMQSYGDYFKDALSKGANPLHAKMMAFTNASMEGVSETIFDNLKFGKEVAKDLLNKRNFDKIAKVFDRGVWDEIAEKQFREIVGDATKASFLAAKKAGGLLYKAGSGLAKEAFEEVPVSITNFVVDAANNPQNVKGRSVLLEAKDAFMNGLVSFSIPALFGLAGSVKQAATTIDKSPAETLMISALQQPYVAESIDRLLKAGKITQEQANQKHQVINTAVKELVNMPKSYADGSSMTWSDREQYLTLSVRQRILEDKIKNSDDEAANAIIQKQLSATIEQKKEMLGVNEKPEAKQPEETKAAGPATVESAVIQVGRNTYEGKNHAQAILAAQAAGEDISKVDREDGQFKLSDGKVISRDQAQKQFGQDRSELLIPQDEEAKKADADYKKLAANKNEKPDLAERVRSILAVPKSEAESEVLMAEGFKNSSDADVIQYATEQAVDAPESLLSALKGDRELTTDLIAQKSPEEIEAAKTKWRQKIKDLADDAPDETILTVRKNVKNAVALLDEGLAKQAEVKKQEPVKQKVRVTAEQAAKLAGKEPDKTPVEQAKIDFADDVAEDHSKKDREEFKNIRDQIDEVNKQIGATTDGAAAAELFQKRNDLYKKLRENLSKISEPGKKVKETSELIDLANEHGVSVSDAKQIKKILDTSKTQEEFLDRYNKFISKAQALRVGKSGSPVVTNFNLGRADRKGKEFEEVLTTTESFEGGDLVQYNRPLKRNIGTAMNAMQRSGKVTWFSSNDKQSNVLGLEMFHDENGKKLTGNETLYEIMTGEGYSNRQRGMAVAYVLAQRLSGADVSKNNTVHDFNTRLFEKLGGAVQLMYNDRDASPLLAATSKGNVVINAYRLGERLAEYVRLGGGERSMLTWAEIAINEELLHLATFKAANIADLEKVYDQMSQEERDLVQHIYQDDLASKKDVAGEYLRMVLQERILGRISSQNGTVSTRGTVTELFRPGANRSKQPGQPAPNERTSVRNFFAKLVSYLRNVFKDSKSEKAKEIIQKVEDFIAGKPLKGAPEIKEAVVKNDPSVFAIEYGGRDHLVQFRQDENGSGYYRVVRDKDGELKEVTDPIKGTSLIGRNIGEARDAIVMTTELLGVSIGESKALKNNLRKAAGVLKGIKTYRDLLDFFEDMNFSDAMENIKDAIPIKKSVKKSILQKITSFFSREKQDPEAVKEVMGDEEFAEKYMKGFVEVINSVTEEVELKDSEGRISMFDVDDNNGNIIVKRGDEITEMKALKMHRAGVEVLRVLTDGFNIDSPMSTDHLFQMTADVGDVLRGTFMLGASQGRGISKNAAGILNKISDEDLSDIIETYKDLTDENRLQFPMEQSEKVARRNAIKNAERTNSPIPLINEFGLEHFIGTAVSHQAITIDEAEVLNAELSNINSDDISGLGFMLNAAQGKSKAQQLWERKQRQLLEDETSRVAEDIKSGKVEYEDAIKGQSDEFAQSLAAKVNPTVADDTFRGTVDRLRDSGYTKAQVISDLSTLRPMNASELAIIDDVYANAYENDPDIQALRESLTDLQAGRRPKSVAARLLHSKVSRIAKLLKEFAYDKTSNQQLEDMADHVLQGVDEKDLEKLIDSMNSLGLADIKNILRAKAIVKLDKSVQPGSRAMATRIAQEWANESTVQGRAIQSNRKAYEIVAANSPRMKSVFARQFVEAVRKKAEDKIRQVVDDYDAYIKETDKLNDAIHQEAIDELLRSELMNKKMQEELDRICNTRNKRKR